MKKKENFWQNIQEKFKKQVKRECDITLPFFHGNKLVFICHL